MNGLLVTPQATQLERTGLRQPSKSVIHPENLDKQRQELIFEGIQHDDIYCPHFNPRYVSIRIFGDLDLAVQHEGAWMHALRGAEVDSAIYQSACIDRLPDELAALIVLSTRADTPDHWQNAGRALSRLLSHASAYRLRVHVFKQTFNIAAERSRLPHPIWGECYPQLLLQIGYVADKTASALEHSHWA